MEHPVTPEEIGRAEKLHSILLFDFIVVHVFLFVLAIGLMKQTGNLSLAIIPAISFALLGYVLLQASQAVAKESSWFVRCHMLLAAKRARLFLLLFLITGTFTAGMFFGGPQLGMSKIASYSLGHGV
jgi:phosphoglycerol transferase MdoB-like AlkP superfamily enzyme